MAEPIERWASITPIDERDVRRGADPERSRMDHARQCALQLCVGEVMAGRSFGLVVQQELRESLDMRAYPLRGRELVTEAMVIPIFEGDARRALYGRPGFSGMDLTRTVEAEILRRVQLMAEELAEARRLIEEQRRTIGELSSQILDYGDEAF